jgi:Mg-chelatase subunit ChlD
MQQARRSILATLLVLAVLPLHGQSDVAPLSTSQKPTVAELVRTGDVTAQVLDMRLLPTKTEFDISLFGTSHGKRVLNYAPPYVSRYEDYKRLWKDYLSETLKLPVNMSELEISEQNDTTVDSYAIGLALDASPSMTKPRSLRMQRAVKHLISVLDTRDQISVVNFSGRTTTPVPLTSNHQQALEDYANVEGFNARRGGSSVYDGIMASLEQLANTPVSTDRALIVFTDGEDNSSGYELDQVVTRAKELNVKIHAIVYGLSNREPLDSLTRLTGGKVRELVDADSFDKVFLGLYNSLRHTYTVSINNRTPDQSESVLTAVTTLRAPVNADLHTRDILQLLPKQNASIPDDAQSQGALVMRMDVDFENGMTIAAKDAASLDSVATLMIQREDIEVEISDLSGDHRSNNDNEMALLRTEAVRELLIKRGVPTARVRSLGNSTKSDAATDRSMLFVFSKR